MGADIGVQEGNTPMLYNVRIEGQTAIIQNSAAGIDPLLPINLEKAEITRKRGSNRTEPDDERLRQLEAIGSLWLDDEERPTIPSTAIRSVIETGARKLKQGPQVREGLAVIDTSFTYDVRVYGESLDELSKTCQFTVPGGRSKKPCPADEGEIRRSVGLRSSPCPWTTNWSSEEWLERWLDIGGRRIGLGDWRPEKSGQYGRFTVSSIYMDEGRLTHCVGPTMVRLGTVRLGVAWHGCGRGGSESVGTLMRAGASPIFFDRRDWVWDGRSP